MSADTPGSGTPLREIDEQIEASTRFAAALLAISSGAQTPALNNLYVHARGVMVACQGWPPTRAQIEEALAQLLPLPDSARATLPTASAAQQQQFSETLTQACAKVQEAKNHMHEFNAQISDSVTPLNADATAVAAELQADQQNLETLRVRAQQINEDYDPSVGHVLTWIGKGVVSAGIWPAIEAANAKSDFDSLSQQFQQTNQDAQVLAQAEVPLGGLLIALPLLEGELLNMAAAAEEADNIMKTVMQTRQDMTDTGDPFYQDTLNELYDHLGRLRDQASMMQS